MMSTKGPPSQLGPFWMGRKQRMQDHQRQVLSNRPLHIRFGALSVHLLYWEALARHVGVCVCGAGVVSKASM